MNKKLFLYFSILFISSQVIFAQNKERHIDINASALFNNESTNNYFILLYEDGNLKDSIFEKKSKETHISLDANKVYSLVFKKENGPGRLVIVNTFLPSGFKNYDLNTFKLQVEVSPDVIKTKEGFEDYPVAILIVNKKKGLLMASEDYYRLTHVQGSAKKS